MPKASTSKAATAKDTARKTAKKPVGKRKAANGYQAPESIPLGEVLIDLSKQQWRIGPSIGSGGFGEIYCACKADSTKKHDDYLYVVKIEPHGNGPLFVEMHFYMRNGKLADIEAFRRKHKLSSIGMPHFVGHGSHELNKIKHRFIVMPRFGRDIWSLFLENGRKFPLHTVYRLAIQMLEVYEYIHECTYVHGDLKGSNILLSYGKNSGAQAYLVDFGLASHYTTKDFKPDPKKMHNGTIEYTSRDAHQGVPTMRGDFEILAYNVIQWAAGYLPWELDKVLSSPPKVQVAKEEFMKNIDSSLQKLFSTNSCPQPILNFTKYVSKMKYDQNPDYEKCRKEFANGLKSLGKSNTGDLDFKIPTAAQKSSTKEKDKKQTRSPQKTNLSKITEKTEDSSAPSPRKKPNLGTDKTKRRVLSPGNDDDDTDFVSPKKIRNAEHIRSPHRNNSNTPKQSTSSASANTPRSDPSIIINNHVTNTNGQKSKTYELNFELDISFDANVVVNVKRKPKKESLPRDNTSKVSDIHNSKKTSITSSTDEIPATEKSYAVGRARVYKKAVRTSPRAHN